MSDAASTSERELHRRFGMQFNNEVWDQIDSGLSPESPAADRDRALYGGYACIRHWLEAGNEANHARGEHLVSRAALAVGLPDVAARHAQRCLALIAEHPAVMADWDAPFGHEALARALAALGQPELAAEHRALAIELTRAVSDPEDRQALEHQLATGPWFGLG